MPDALESLARATADPLRRRIGCDQRGMLLLELQQLAHQIVEFGVADLGLVGEVIELFVMADEAAKFCDS